MDNTKPAIESVTLYVNLALAILAVLYFYKPELKDVVSPEMIIGLGAAVNAAIRVIKTDKGIEGIV